MSIGKDRMTIMARRLFTLLLALVSVAALALAAQTRPGGTPHRQLLVIFDGLRPDYVTPGVMPNLYALGQRGVVFANHHSVFPTVTRVNASSFSTGSYPERHGLLGNTVFFPQVDASRFLDTSDRENLVKIDAATGQHLLTNATLGETLQAAGKKMMVVSAGSTGSALLLNHKLDNTSTQMGYNLAKKQSERRAALKEWSEKLDEWKATEPGKILPFEARSSA